MPTQWPDRCPMGDKTGWGYDRVRISHELSEVGRHG